jgi:hypothetical protein
MVFANIFRFYSRSNANAVFTNIPIHLLAEFRSVYPGKYKIRYRGPRSHRKFDSGMNRASYCLRKDAKTFSAYTY